MNIHFNGYKARYNFLNYHLQPVLRSRKIRNINIFINLDNLFHTLHRPLINNEFQVGGNNAHIELVSNIFNLIGHYRNWALKMGCRCKLYVTYTSATHSFKNSIWIPQYRKKFLEINDPTNSNYYFINTALHDSYKILHVISRYIKDVYVIDSKYLEPAMIPMMIGSEIHPADWNILISRDTYDLQYSYQEKWTLISPKGDNSTCVNQENLWNYLNVKERIYKDPKDLHYHYGLYLISRAVVGDTYRNIPRLRRIGWKTLFKYLDQLQESKNNDFDNQILQEHYFTELVNNNKIDSDVLNKHLYALNVNIQMSNLLELDRSIVTSQIVDMEDYKNLQELNRTIFHLYPINLNFLCNELITSGF